MRSNFETVRSRAYGSAKSIILVLGSQVVQADRRAGRFVVAAAVLILFVAVQVAPAVQKDDNVMKAKAVSAGAFRLVGSDGKQYASLSRGSKGETTLSFLDGNGRPHMILGMDQNGAPIISMSDDRGLPRLTLSLDDKDGSPQIAMIDGAGLPAITIGAAKETGGAVTIGTVGKDHIFMNVSPDGTPAIQLWDSKKNPRLLIEMLNEQPCIRLLGSHRDVRATWQLLKDGRPAFLLADDQSNTRLSVTISEKGKASVQKVDPLTNVGTELK
jgi:hypothetical protein